MPERCVIGWDIGGAHVKAALLDGGVLRDAAQWPCRLWLGLEQLAQAVDAARARWPALAEADHAVTMTGEMCDLFAHREDGVRRIAALLEAALPAPHFYAGDAGGFGDAGDAGWCSAGEAGAHWSAIASANWLASAQVAAEALAPEAGLLVDIGSTTTDLIAFRGGRVLTASRDDAERLAHHELVYQGVVRTPLMALAQRIEWRGAQLNVMNEVFATSADIYRLTGELDPAHDQHPSADAGPKDEPGSRQRLARMIGLDARDAGADEWLAFARAWRARQVAALRTQIEHALARNEFDPRHTLIVGAGCGDFLLPALAPAQRTLTFAELLRADRALAGWAGVCAPAVAVAALFAARKQR